MTLWGGREKELRAGRRTLGAGSVDDTVRARKSPAVAVLTPDPLESGETDEHFWQKNVNLSPSTAAVTSKSC